MRKAKEEPSWDIYLKNITGQEEALVTVLKGHLVIEALLVELIQLRIPGDRPWRWNFPTKLDKCIEFGFISHQQAEAIKELNDLRNDFGHVLGQDIDFKRVFNIVKKAADAGFDFSDDTIHQDRKKSEEWYGIIPGLHELLNSFFFDLAFILHENGGADRLG